jgi:hypothetical protein
MLAFDESATRGRNADPHGGPSFHSFVPRPAPKGCRPPLLSAIAVHHYRSPART